jgi:hypothetical protein
MTKTTIHIFTIFTFSIFLLSCNGKQKENSPETKQETPKALQEDELDTKSYSRSNSDLTEELYQELVDKTPALKNLEDDLSAFRTEPYDINEKFNKYDSKSKSYYSSVNSKAATIKDSLLRQKIIDLITNSNDHYTHKTAELNSLLQQISQKTSTLDDHHTVLKIVLTLPLIEKYQNDNQPANKEFKDLIKNQVKLIERTDSLTSKY